VLHSIRHTRFPRKQTFTAILGILVLGGSFSFAIAATTGYAWSENLGWINFGTPGGNVQVTDSGLSGYAWSTNYGWINLNPVDSGVKNDSNGNLSGYAWGEQTGYIGFAGVVINSSGVFTGQANGTVTGLLNFNCTYCNVTTDWRPTTGTTGATSSNAGVSVNAGGGGGGGGGYAIPETVSPASSTIISTLVLRLQQLLSFLAPAPTQPPPVATTVPQVAPPPLRGQWALVAPPALSRFVLAPLPQNVSLFVEKFPELKQTFAALGVTRASALPKLQGVTFSLPSITESGGLPQAEITSGKLVLPAGIPLATLSPSVKQGIPPEIVFARSSDERIDLNETVNINAQGNAETQMHVVAGQTIKLVVKPVAPANSVTGYLVLRSRDQIGLGGNNRAMNLQAALVSLVFSNPLIAQNAPQDTADVDQRLALTNFTYKDEGDGIYTADVVMPGIDGTYDVITLISYTDPELGTREIGLTTVVDPEGYVYQADNGKQTRIPNATVSLLWQNPGTGTYEIWPAAEYSQENPQVTGLAGTYAFLVPQGRYYLAVSAPGYRPYVGAPFDAVTGSNIDDDIQLYSSAFWATWDWQTVLLIIIAILLAGNFYREWRLGHFTPKQ